MHHLLLKKITKTLELGWFGVVYSWSLCILGGMYLIKDKLGLKNDLSGNSLFMFLINSEQRIACLTAKFSWT
jgi:hypothetical protein